MSAALRFVAVSIVRGGRVILDRVDLEVAQGERWVLLGRNGAGKSTLLAIAAGYELPTSGCAEILGQRVGAVDLRDLRARIGYASARMRDLLRPHQRVVEAVLAGRRGHAGIFDPVTVAEEQQARGLLEEVGLAQLADDRIDHLSEGERQRVQLARTLMAPRELLLLDEPTAGLDLAGREALVARLDRGAEGQSVVFATHHLEEVPATATHAALLREGRLLAAGAVGDVLDAAHLSACFGVPLRVERRDGRWGAWHAGLR